MSRRAAKGPKALVQANAIQHRPAGSRRRDGYPRLNWLIQRVKADPTRALAASLLSTALLSVAINALFLQTMKHPAPLFSAAPAHNDVSGEIPRLQGVPVPLARPVSLASAPLPDAASSPRNEAAASGEIAASSAPPASAAPSEPVAADAIARLISATNGREFANPPPNKTVLAAQHALNKLGYTVRPDGVNGGSTRQAVEKFERDNRLPVKGDLTPKILRALGVATGTPIE